MRDHNQFPPIKSDDDERADMSGRQDHLPHPQRQAQSVSRSLYLPANGLYSPASTPQQSPFQAYSGAPPQPPTTGPPIHGHFQQSPATTGPPVNGFYSPPVTTAPSMNGLYHAPTTTGPPVNSLYSHLPTTAPPVNGLCSPPSAPQQRPFAPYPEPPLPSPTAPSNPSSGMHRGLAPLPGMTGQYNSQPTRHISHINTTYNYHVPLSGPVLNNLHQPGQPPVLGNGMMSHPYNGIYHHPTRGHYAPHPERPHKCEQCQQAFSRGHDLKRHKKIHLSVKPFPCGSCEKAFSRKDALKRHRLVKQCGLRDEDRKGETNGAPRGSRSPPDPDHSPAAPKNDHP